MGRIVRRSAEQRGYPVINTVSGAGHDAFDLARIVPTIMIFVPCQDGISHNEQEYAEPEHRAAGATRCWTLCCILPVPVMHPA